MDTYFHTNWNCVRCGRCVKVCHEEGEGYLTGRRDKAPDCDNFGMDYVPCHHCGTDGFGNKPCQQVCHYNAIEIERW